MIDTTNKILQQVFDEIAAALIKQGKKCVDDNGNCVYQDDDGNHCAIGHLLVPNSKAMEFGTSLDDMLEDFDEDEIGVNSGFLHENRKMLSLIQCIHDAPHKAIAIGHAKRLELQHNIDISAWSEWIEALPR